MSATNTQYPGLTLRQPPPPKVVIVAAPITTATPIPAGLTVKVPPTKSISQAQATPSPVFDPTYAAVPQGMKNLDRWLAFEVTWNPAKNKFDKKPVNSRGIPTNEPKEAESFETMFAYVNSRKNVVLGYYIDDPYIGIDPDDSRDPKTGVIDPKVMEILRELNSYSEVSPSGTGIRIIVTGKKPGDSCRKGSMEIYSHKRAVTITGLHIEGTPATVNPADVSGLYNRMMNGEFFSEKQRAAYSKTGAASGGRIESTSNIITTGLQVLMAGEVQCLKPFEMSDGFGTSIFYDSPSEAVGGLLTRLAIKHKNLESDECKDEIRKDFEVSHLYAQLPHWNSGQRKWERLGEGEIDSAFAFIKGKTTTAAITSAPTAKVEPSAWGEPRKFEMGLPPVLPFDVTCLPHCLRPLVLDVSVRVGVPVEFVAVALVNALAGVVGRRAFVYPRELDNTWKESLNLWGGIIAGPGDKKTPLINAVLEPANRIRLEWDAENRAAQKQYKSELAAYKSAMKKIAADKKAVEKVERDAKKKNKKGEAIESQESDDAKAPAEVKAEMFLSPPVEPINRVFMMNEATPEWLQNANAENPEGLFIVQDELAGWVAEQDATGRELERSLYLAAWNGNSVHGVGRVTRDGRIARLCWSLFGGFQPDTVRKFLEACLIVVDGTFPRFQNFVWPDPLDPAARKGVDRTPNEEAIRSVEKVFRALLEMKEDQVSLHFAKGLAREKFNTWYDVLNDRIYAEKAPHIQQHLAKYPGFMTILAGLFQLVDLVANQNTHVKDGEVTDDTPITGFREIDADHAEQAIKLVAILESHARRIYSCIKSSTQLSEESLATHILAGDLEDGLTVRDIRRNNWKGLTRDDQIEDALAGLEELKWVREVEVERSPKGGRPTTRWDINPALKRGSNAAF